VFADVAKMEASLDPNLKDIVDAPPAEEDPPLPEWLTFRAPELPPEHQSIEARAREYGRRAHDWMDAHGTLSAADPGDPRAVIGWLLFFIPAKVHRALHGLALDVPEERDSPTDHDGSAKAALVAIDRSHGAWLDVVDQTPAWTAEIAPFIIDLIWLGDALERTFPNARAFVRPAFDEPDEVAKLLAEDRE
jgi:hypothetical protein